MPEGLCLCASLPRLAPHTNIEIVAHRTELFKSTNTGKLTAHMLEGARVVCSAEPSDEPAREGAWVLFPSEHALPLAEAARYGVRTVLVPDGTWTQARRIARRNARCRVAPHVRLEVERTSSYRLRRNVRAGGVCTLEAVAEALRVLEGDTIADELLAVLERWVVRAERVRQGDHDERVLAV